MPSIKHKTHKGTKARFKVSATGKVLHKPCGSSHLNSHKSGKKIRRLRRSKVLQNKTVSQKLRRVLGVRNRRLMSIPVVTEEVETGAEESTAPAEG